MIIESGVIVAAGLLFTFMKCSWAARMRMLSNPLFMDVFIFILLNLIHWGTFSGVMVAATGALICSGLLSLGRYVYGHIDSGVYFPGMRDVSANLVKA
jgi:hypothetical protein